MLSLESLYNSNPSESWRVGQRLRKRPLTPLLFLSLILDCLSFVSSLESTVKYDKSTIKVTISVTSLPTTLQEDSRSSIRFDAEVDWRQRHEFLKFEIPLNIHTQEATFDAAFGNIQRPTHRNTTQELAKFEVCGHKVC